jgi:hypothetical protein
MKESMDTDAHPLTKTQIADDVNLVASLDPSYITVDTFMEYPAYMHAWVDAVRAAGKRVWFRIHPNQWEDSNNTVGIMSPEAYEAEERSFIAAHASLFHAGDILDPCPEPENGFYWNATYGPRWREHAPNAATDAFNAFIRDTTRVADVALHTAGVDGVITSIRSTTAWLAETPKVLYPATIAWLGLVTVDSYPDSGIVDPAIAAADRINELKEIESIRRVPIIIGEMGFSTGRSRNVDGATQRAVLKAEFDALARLPYLRGVNYWVGAGSSQIDFSRLFDRVHGAWTLRPAAGVVKSFYATYGV